MTSSRPSLLHPLLNRGLTGRRIRKALTQPLWAFRNARYHWIRTTSHARHIFVIGPPRSGTTLMQSILRAHPRLAGLDEETYFFFRRDYLSLRYPEIEPAALRRMVTSARDAVDLFDRIAEFVIKKNCATRFVEKTPVHALRLPFLQKYFPQAQFIFLVRDPRDGYLSALRNPRVKVNTIPLYADSWKKSVAAYQAANLSGRVLLVRYEDLCQDSRSALSHIMAFLGEDVTAEQVDPKFYSQTKYSNQLGHQRLNQPISAETVGTWRLHLSGAQIAAFDRILKSEMEQMGYVLTRIAQMTL